MVLRSDLVVCPVRNCVLLEHELSEWVICRECTLQPNILITCQGPSPLIDTVNVVVCLLDVGKDEILIGFYFRLII